MSGGTERRPGSADNAINPELERMFAKRMGATTSEVSSSHCDAESTGPGAKCSRASAHVGQLVRARIAVMTVTTVAVFHAPVSSFGGKMHN